MIRPFLQSNPIQTFALKIKQNVKIPLSAEIKFHVSIISRFCDYFFYLINSLFIAISIIICAYILWRYFGYYVNEKWFVLDWQLWPCKMTSDVRILFVYMCQIPLITLEAFWTWFAVKITFSIILVNYSLFVVTQSSTMKNNLNFKFRFLGIIIPKKWSAETGLLLGIAGSLILRSVSDIWMIQNATIIESAIITSNRPKFRSALWKFLAAMPAVSWALIYDCTSYELFLF